jgi:SH3-like domain-containing protein
MGLSRVKRIVAACVAACFFAGIGVAEELGAVTNLPLPRYVSLKSNEGNARRGPGLTHRIDWVFTRAGMPLRVTAEYENWRRIEDAEGAGGWVHYALLSGSRTVLVADALLDLRSDPNDQATVMFQAEAGVIGRLMACTLEWCRISVDGQRGWAPKVSLWGVDPGEVFE